VPKILLGLGASCLLVASVIFLAVAWSWLGIGGRTAVLVGLTAASAIAGQWLARRGLGVGGEALTSVALGLLVLDLVGARNAGWLGAPTAGWFVVVVGTALLVASTGLCLPDRRLFAPQVVAPLGLGLASLGVAGTTGQLPATAAGAVLACACLVSLGRTLGAVVLTWTSVVAGLVAFAGLGLLALGEAVITPTARWLWLEGHGTWMLVAAALALLPWLMAPGHDDLRQLTCAFSASVVTVTAALPVLDEGPTAVTLAAAAGSVAWAVAAAAAPPRWYAVPRVPLVGSLLVLLPAPIGLAGQAVTNLLTVADPFTADAAVRLDPETPVAHPLLLPLAVVVAMVAAALALPRRPLARAAGATLVATGVLTAALHPLPLWVFVAVTGPLGLVLAAPSAVLTLLVLAEIVLLTAALLLRRVAAVEPLAGVVLPVAIASFVWTGGHLLEVPFGVRSLVTLAAVGLLAVAVPRLEVEVGAAAAVTVSSVAGVAAAADPSVTAAIHLTLAGAAVTTSSLVHRDHRPLAWLGGLLLAAATWVRLQDLGVQAPEAYTLPTALALVLVGVHRLSRDVDANTTTALLPGLGLATVPSLLWALADPLSPRAALLGAVCLLLLLGGAALRWSAPVVVGALVGATLLLRELAPYAVETPQWVVIGAAGAVLIGAGITWEARLRDLRQAAGYLGRLR
jgi:hypothetical protein